MAAVQLASLGFAEVPMERYIDIRNIKALMV
jgi:hypothetical protein